MRYETCPVPGDISLLPGLLRGCRVDCLQVHGDDVMDIFGMTVIGLMATAVIILGARVLWEVLIDERKRK